MAQHPRPIGPTTNTAAPFGQEMVAGWRPAEPRLFSTRNWQGWSTAQTTHVQAAFSPDMVQGVTVPQTRYRKPFPQGTQWWTPEVQAFGIEMVQGSKPDQPRLFLAPRIPLPLAQTTQVDAPISVEMLQGWGPLTQRYRRPFYDSSTAAPQVDAFSIEMVQGWRPDQKRGQLGPRLAQGPAQTTQVDAPFSTEMTQGSSPARFRQRLAPYLNLPVGIYEDIIVVIAAAPPLMQVCGWIHFSNKDGH